MLIDNQLMYEEMQNLIKLQKIDDAKKIANKCYPQEAMDQLGKMVDESLVTNGDMGVLFSLGMRWLPHFISLKQQLGLESVRINFATTLHEPLAQAPGRETYFIDTDGNYWKTFGSKETGAQILETNELKNISESDSEIFNKGLKVSGKTIVNLTMLTQNRAFFPGKYILKLYCSDSEDHLGLNLVSNKTLLPLKRIQSSKSYIQYEIEPLKKGKIQLDFSMKDTSDVIINGLEFMKL